MWINLILDVKIKNKQLVYYNIMKQSGESRRKQSGESRGKQSGESRRKPYNNIKCITICVEAHGVITTTDDGRVGLLNPKTRQNATILNIPSGITRCGIMDANCKSMVIKGNKKQSVSDVALCGQAIDVMSMEYFHHVYNEISKNEGISGCDIANEGIKIISDKIQLIYANNNIPYYHDYKKYDILTHPSESYKLTTPHYNKLYTMYPNIHETCVDETCEEGKCKLRPYRDQYCPEYGITVLHSSDPSDTEYTLCGLPMITDIEINENERKVIKRENRLAINLNQAEGHAPLKIKNGVDEDNGDDEYFDEDGNLPTQKKSCYDYWLSKLDFHMRLDLYPLESRIRELTIQKRDLSEEDKMTKIPQIDDKIKGLNKILSSTRSDWQMRQMAFTRMTTEIDRYKPQSQLTPEEISHLPQISLENLIKIFVDGMKYDHVYIIDPTCNSYEFSGSRPVQLFKILSNNILERIRTKSNRPSFLPINYIKQTSNPTDDVIEIPRPKKTMKRARSKSIGGKRKQKRNRTKKRNKK